MKNSKNILYSKMGVTPLDMQYGGGLDDAYMTLRDRKRRSAFADPNATSAFADPNNPSAFIPDRFPVSSNKGGGLPMIYRQGGGISHEDMAAEMDQEDADVGADVGAVSGPGGDYDYWGVSDLDILGAYADPDKQIDIGDTVWTATPEEIERQKQADIAKDKQTDKDIYERYGDAYGEQMSVKDPDDPSKGYLDSYGSDFGRTGFLGLFGPTKTRTQAIKENEQALLNDYIDRYGVEEGEKLFESRYMNRPDSVFMGSNLHNLTFGDLQQNYRNEITRALLENPNSELARALDRKEIAEFWASRKESDEKDKFIEFDPTLENLADKVGNKFKSLSDYMGENFKQADEKTISQIAKDEFGLIYKPASEGSMLGKALQFAVPGVGTMMGITNVAAALMGEKVLGSLYDPTTGKSLTLHESGKVTSTSIEDDPMWQSPGLGPQEEKKKRRVRKKKVVPQVASTPEKEGLEGYYSRLQKERPAQSRVASNKYIRELLEYLYPDPTYRPRLG